MPAVIRLLGATPATPIVNSIQTLVAGTTISITSGVAHQVCRITSASAIALTSNPQIAAGSIGQVVRIVNTGSNVITFANTNGISLNGTLALGSTQWAEFVNLGGLWQLGAASASPVWTAASFVNSFTNTSGLQNCEFTKFFGRVSVRGLANRSVTYSGQVTIFTLPTGFRPTGNGNLRFPVDPSSISTATVDITTTGVVSLLLGSGTPATQFVGLDAITFLN